MIIKQLNKMEKKIEEQLIAEGKMLEIGALIKSAIGNLEFYIKRCPSEELFNKTNVGLALEKLKKAFEKTGIKVEREGFIKQKDELLHFDFKDEPMTEETAKELNNCFNETLDYLNKVAPNKHLYNAGSDYDVDKYYQTATWTTGYSEPTVQLKYVCNLTQYDVDTLVGGINSVRSLITYAIRNCKNQKDRNDALADVNSYLNNIINYLYNYDGMRDKNQKWQLQELEKESKPKKSYKGTLGEHWKELSTLFCIKENFGLESIKEFDREYSVALKTNAIYSPELKDVYEGYRKALFDLRNIARSLGIDFISDFIKACEKCED